MADNDVGDTQYPDNDEYIPYVTGGNLAQKNGSKIMCWGLVTKVTGSDGFFVKTVDDQEIQIKLRNPISEALEGWYEIHGVSKGKSILCDDYTPFPPELTTEVDKEGHRGLVRILAALDDPWNLGDAGTNGNEGVVPME